MKNAIGIYLGGKAQSAKFGRGHMILVGIFTTLLCHNAYSTTDDCQNTCPANSQKMEATISNSSPTQKVKVYCGNNTKTQLASLPPNQRKTYNLCYQSKLTLSDSKNNNKKTIELRWKTTSCISYGCKPKCTITVGPKSPKGWSIAGCDYK